MHATETTVPSSDWIAAATRLRDSGAVMLDFLTAVDEPSAGEIELVLHLVDVPGRARHLLRTRLGRTDPSVPTLVDVLPGAAWHEREVHELFGVDFPGNPDLRPLLTDGHGAPLLRTTPLDRRVATRWPGAVDPADRPAARPGRAPGGYGKVAARPRSRLVPPGIPAEWSAPDAPAPDAPARDDSPTQGPGPDGSGPDRPGR